MTTALPPVRATGLLGEFAAAGLLVAGDVQVARTLGRLAGETDGRVLLAAALAVRATRHGSVCVDLAGIASSAVPEAYVDPAGPTDAGPTDAGPTDAGPTDAGPTDALESSADPRVGSATLPWPAVEDWVARCAASPLVGTAPPPGPWVRAARSDPRPLHLAGTRIYLDRYAQLEDQVRLVIRARAARPSPPVDPAVLAGLLARPLGVDPPSAQQRLAVAAAVTGWFTVIAGGPGTGKTTSVAGLLRAVAELAAAAGEPPPRVALCAPTGRAAARLQESVAGQLTSTGAPVPAAYTVHRLLGWVPGSRTRFRHDLDNRLPYDLVVVDETSMASLELTARLMEALPVDCRLVLVGDPDQLASVDAGAVLGDLVARPARPPDGSAEADRREAVLAALPDDLLADPAVVADLRRDTVRLRDNYRFSGLLQVLADAVRAGEVDAALDVLATAGPAGDPVQWVDADAAVATQGDLVGLRTDVAAAGVDMVTAARAGDAAAALAALGRHRLLCVHRAGRYGVTYWRDLAHSWIAAAVGPAGLGGIPPVTHDDDFHVGRPLLVTANDQVLGLYNGDTGVVVATEDGMAAAFDRVPGLVPLSRLPTVATPLAMTVHKAQGSEADHVTVVLPPADSPLLSRELLYTAVTRARSTVRIVGTEAAVRTAVGTAVVRASGLREP